MNDYNDNETDTPIIAERKIPIAKLKIFLLVSEYWPKSFAAPEHNTAFKLNSQMR